MSELVLENEIEQIGFDYSGLENSVAVKAQIAASNIKLRLKRTVEDIIEIGRELKEIKAVLSHGKFLPWIESEFEMGRQTAQDFMNVAEKFGNKLPPGGNINPGKVLYLLAAPSTPDSIVDKALAASEAGEKITVDWVKREREMVDAIKREKGETQKYRSLWEQSLAAEEVQRDYANNLKENGGVKTVEVVKEVVIEKIPEDYETLKKSIADYQEHIAANNYAREKLIEEQERAIAEAKRSRYKADKAARERDEQAIAEREKQIRQLDRDIEEKAKRAEELQRANNKYTNDEKALKVHFNTYRDVRQALINFYSDIQEFGAPINIEEEQKVVFPLIDMLEQITAGLKIFIGNTVVIENKGTQNETVQTL